MEYSLSCLEQHPQFTADCFSFLFRTNKFFVINKFAIYKMESSGIVAVFVLQVR